MRPSRKSLVVVAVGTFCCLTGCGTLGRISMYADPETFHDEYTAFYPSTAYDVVAVGLGGIKWIAGDHETTPSGFDLGLVVPFHIVDIPISIATDTLCLPWDIVVAIESHKEQTNAIDEH